jgi:hypothetical protein
LGSGHNFNVETTVILSIKSSETFTKALRSESSSPVGMNLQGDESAIIDGHLHGTGVSAR